MSRGPKLPSPDVFVHAVAPVETGVTDLLPANVGNITVRHIGGTVLAEGGYPGEVHASVIVWPNDDGETHSGQVLIGTNPDLIGSLGEEGEYPA